MFVCNLIHITARYPKDQSLFVALGSPSACKKNGVVFDCCGPFCHEQPLNCPTVAFVGAVRSDYYATDVLMILSSTAGINLLMITSMVSLRCRGSSLRFLVCEGR